MKVLVADDHQLFIDGIRHILSKLDDHMFITEANRAQAAIDVLDAGENFDLVLIDLSMPGMDGTAILSRLHARKIWQPVVVISGEEDYHKIKAVLDLGALGFIPKSHSSAQMLAALRTVLDGEIYLPDNIEKQLNSLNTRRPPEQAGHNSALRGSGITKRQYEVLTLMAKGYSNKQIATSLFLTEHTIKTHIGALFSALSVSNRTECVQSAIRQGLIDA